MYNFNDVHYVYPQYVSEVAARSNRKAFTKASSHVFVAQQMHESWSEMGSGDIRSISPVLLRHIKDIRSISISPVTEHILLQTVPCRQANKIII